MANQNFRVKTGLEVGTGVTISSGIVSAVSFRGDGGSLTGIAVTVDVRTNSLAVSGVSTLGSTIVGGGTTQLIVNGDVRITGILTIGTSSITLDGSNNSISLGTGTTISSTGSALFNHGIVVSGVTTSASFVRPDGTSSQFLKADGSVDSSTYLTSYTETSTLANVTSRGNSTTNGISVGVLTATTINDSSGNVRIVPQNSQSSSYILTTSDTGKHISITTGGITVPPNVFSVGDNVTIYNNSSFTQTITQGAGVTLRFAGTADTGNRTIDQYGLATILCVAPNVFVFTGSGVA